MSGQVRTCDLEVLPNGSAGRRWVATRVYLQSGTYLGQVCFRNEYDSNGVCYSEAETLAANAIFNCPRVAAHPTLGDRVLAMYPRQVASGGVPAGSTRVRDFQVTSTGLTLATTTIVAAPPTAFGHVDIAGAVNQFVIVEISQDVKNGTSRLLAYNGSTLDDTETFDTLSATDIATWTHSSGDGAWFSGIELQTGSSYSIGIIHISP